jgi:hypothetical protein
VKVPIMNPTQKVPPLAKLMIGATFLMLVAGGVGLVVKGVKAIGESRESRTWPTASGRIVRSEMVQGQRRSTRRDGNNRSLTETSTTFEAAIEYEFEVNGVKRRGTRVTIAESITNRSIAQKLLDKYPLDRTVTVTYKPDDPSVCVLEPGSWGGVVVYFALGTVFLSIPVVLLLVIRKTTRPHSAASSPPPPDQADWAE